ncbi:MAG: phospholipase D family protein, partial [Burkholderiaceae bacterium]
MNHVLRPITTACCGILAALLTACATTPKPKDPPTPSYVITAPDATPLGRQVATLRPRTARAGQSGLFLLGQGVEAFSTRVGLARRATRTLDVQYYAVFNDESGILLVGEMIDAARRGIRVRLLVDDLHASGGGLDLGLLASIPGIEV